MKYLSILTEEEIKKICSSVPYRNIIAYFQKNPKEFAKIRPGFRAEVISQSDAKKLLFVYRNKDFISSFIERIVEKWLNEIQNEIKKYIDSGDSELSAYIHTLAKSYFSDNVSAYFKLIHKEYSSEQLVLISFLVEELGKQEEKCNDKIKQQKYELNDIHVFLNQIDADLKKLKSSIVKFNDDKEKFTLFENNINYQNEKLKLLESQIVEIKSQREGIDKKIFELAQEVSRIAKEQIDSEDLKKKENITITKVRSVPQHPIDIEDFENHLGYNIENIGISNQAHDIFLLRKYLTNIIFQGIPIIANRPTCINLIKCISNTLIGTQQVEELTYTPQITTENITHFISSAKRIVLLDNFIGNYNETLLMPILETYRNKIIFLSTIYDRTLNYVSPEIFMYCHYINVNRMPRLLLLANLNEEPFTADEESFMVEYTKQENRFSRIIQNILKELNFLPSVFDLKKCIVQDEETLCEVLLFDILPYCTDVLQQNPFHISETLQRYAGINGKCPYKNLFGDWFYNE